VRLFPIEVRCYSAQRADECPTAFRVPHRWVEIAQITDRWYQGDRDPEWPNADNFSVLGADNRAYLLRHDRESDDWSLVAGSKTYPKTCFEP